MDLFLQATTNGILLGGIYLVISLGLSLMFGVLHIINIAQGEFVMLGAYAAYWLFVFFGINPLFSFPLIFMIFFIGGYFLQKIAINRVIGGPPLISLVLLFGISLIFRNTALYVWTADYRAITIRWTGKHLVLFGVHVPLLHLITFIIAFISIYCLFIFLQKTKIGTAIEATAQDREAARLLGVDVKEIYATTFAIGAGLAALGGALLSSIFSIFPNMGITYTLLAFFVVVLGGMGYLPGTFIGALTLGIAQSFIVVYLGARHTYMLTFLMLYLLLVFRPKGILGKGIV